MAISRKSKTYLTGFREGYEEALGDVAERVEDFLEESEYYEDPIISPLLAELLRVIEEIEYENGGGA